MVNSATTVNCPLDGTGHELLNAWLDSLLTSLEKFLETSGATAAASGNGEVLAPYRPLLLEKSSRLRKVSEHLATASCPMPESKRKASISSTIASATSDEEDVRTGKCITSTESTLPSVSMVDSSDIATFVDRRSSGRTEMRQRHVTRFLESDLQGETSPSRWFAALLRTLRDVVRSRRRMLSTVQSISFFAMFYSLIFTPLIICFRLMPSPAVSLAEVLCELVLLANVIAPFACGLPDMDTQEWITSPSAVLAMYSHGWLAIDILVAVPWHVMWLMTGEETLLRLSLLRLVLLPKLVSQFIFGDFVVFGTSFLPHLHPNLLRVVKLIGFFFLAVHLIACGYWNVASGGMGSWAAYAVEQPLLIERWTSAYYWALCGVLGENMEPGGHTETAYNCAAIVAGVLLNSCISGSVTAVLGTLDERASRQKAKLDTINTFMNKNHVSTEVCDQVRQYYRYLSGSVASHVDGGMFDELSDSLRLKLSLCLHKKFIKRCHLFARCPSDCVVALVDVISRNWVILVPSELLYKKGAPGDGMYFVSKGEVVLYDPGTVRDESSIDLMSLRRFPGEEITGGARLLEECKSGDFFGEAALLVEDCPREASVTAVSFVELLNLPRADFDSVTARFPAFLSSLRSHRRRRSSGLSGSSTMTFAEAFTQKAGFAGFRMRRFKGSVGEPSEDTSPRLPATPMAEVAEQPEAVAYRWSSLRSASQASLSDTVEELPLATPGQAVDLR